MRSFIFTLALVTTVSGIMISTNVAQAGDDTAQTIAKNLKQSGKLKDYRVGVKYEDGVAWLMGTVTSPQQKQIAEQLARQSAGVDHVVSKLAVEGQSQSDRQLQVASREIPTQLSNVRKTPRKQRAMARNNTPRPYARTAGMRPGQPIQPVNFSQAQYQSAPMAPAAMGPTAMGPRPPMAGGAAVSYDNPQLPGYAWPSYAASPNYAALTYPKQYSASAWPYIGPFYPYPQVPLGWRKVTLEWDDGWWNLDFADHK